MTYDDRYSDEQPPRRPSRPRDDGYGPQSRHPSRPRPDGVPPPPRRDAAPRRGRADGASPGASWSGSVRDFARRVRDSFSGSFEPRRRPDPRRDARSARGQQENNYSYGYGRSAEWDEAASPEWGPGDGWTAEQRKQPPANLTDRDGTSRSLARRLIARRRRVREAGMPPGRRAFISATLAIFAVLVIVGGGFGAGYAYADTLKYENNIIRLGLSQAANSSRIYDRHGTVLYQTLGQNTDHRFPLNYCQIPDVVKWATIDAEDHNFWDEQTGIDPIGLIRAATVNAGSGSTQQGGSTITQQLVKLEVLADSSRSVTRKIDEAILSVDVSQRYTRQDILTMYLNIVPYGFNNDGIDAAARAYFHLKPIDITLDASDPNYTKYQAYVQQYLQCAKDQHIAIQNNKITLSAAWQLEPWQATLLAGVPNNPNDYNPFAFPNISAQRQRDGVLIQMNKYGHLNYLTLPDAKGIEQPVSHYVDVYNYTLDRITKADPKTGTKLYIYANAYDGAGGSPELAPYFVQYVIDQLSKYFSNGSEGFATAGWNVYTTLDYGNPTTDKNLSRIYFGLDGQIHATGYDPETEHWLSGVGIQQYADYVTRRDVTQTFPNYWYCNFAEAKIVSILTDASQNPFADSQRSCLVSSLNNPFNNVYDGATTAIDPRNGDILAMVGGVDYNSTGNTKLDGGQVNVVTSDKRSLGSSFKPVVYATALEMGWTPGTIIRDQPTCFPVANTNEARPADRALCPGNYLPHNYEDTNWAGPQPIRYLLSNSLNTPAELSLSYVGMRANSTDNISPLIPMAERLGIHGLNPRDIGPSAALGTLSVSLLDLTSAYSTFANYGKHMDPRAILQVTNADGSEISDGKGGALFPYVAQPQGYQAISPQTAYMLTSMLTDNDARVGNFGIDNPLHFPGRDVAAKTGTSDSVKDIVTMGYTPWLALGVWNGNADGEAMNHVIGITGAAYIFHDVMAYAMDRLAMPGPSPSFKSDPSVAGGYFKVPPGLHRAILNCHTGLAPWKGQDVSKEQCDPSTKDRVPLTMTPEFDHCSSAHPAYNPNQTEKCAQKFGKPDSFNKAWDGWWCLSWGCSEQGAQDQGTDIVWVPNGQDPTVP